MEHQPDHLHRDGRHFDGRLLGGRLGLRCASTARAAHGSRLPPPARIPHPASRLPPLTVSAHASPPDAAKLTAVLWAVGLLSKLKNNDFDVGTLKDNPVETVVAAAAAYLAFA